MKRRFHKSSNLFFHCYFDLNSISHIGLHCTDMSAFDGSGAGYQMTMLHPSVDLFDALFTSQQEKITAHVNNTGLQAQLYLQGSESSMQQPACQPETAGVLCRMQAARLSFHCPTSSDDV